MNQQFWATLAAAATLIVCLEVRERSERVRWLGAILAVCSVVLLAGCASIESAGASAYKAIPPGRYEVSLSYGDAAGKTYQVSVGYEKDEAASAAAGGGRAVLRKSVRQPRTVPVDMPTVQLNHPDTITLGPPVSLPAPMPTITGSSTAEVKTGD